MYALSKFPALDAPKTLRERTLAASLPPHELMGTDRYEENAPCDDRLVDEPTGTRFPLAGRQTPQFRRYRPVVF